MIGPQGNLKEDPTVDTTADTTVDTTVDTTRESEKRTGIICQRIKMQEFNKLGQMEFQSGRQKYCT